MFIRNPSFVKQKTLRINDDDIYTYLKTHNIQPIGKQNDTWFYLNNKRISSLLKQYRKDGDINRE